MISLFQISEIINGKVVGNKDLNIVSVCDIEVGEKSCISYLKNSSYKKYIKKSNAAAFIVDTKIDILDFKKSFIVVDNPSKSFIKLLSFFKKKVILSKDGISDKSFISSKSKIGKNVFIGPNVTIEDKVSIGDNVKIDASSFIGYNSIISKNSEICSNVVIHENVKIGRNCRIDSGTVIGSEGFGIYTSIEDNKNFNIPHIGSVNIGDFVSIGSNCSIDRGTINNTIIGEYSKLDNLIQIGHNVNIGKNCLIASQVGIAGSTIIGNNVIIAGQVGIIDHITIGDYSIIAVKSCVYKSLPRKSFVSGIPAINHSDRLKQEAIIKKLPELYKKIKKI